MVRFVIWCIRVLIIGLIMLIPNFVDLPLAILLIEPNLVVENFFIKLRFLYPLLPLILIPVLAYQHPPVPDLLLLFITQ